jgi:hypothetical protein
MSSEKFDLKGIVVEILVNLFQPTGIEMSA